MRPHQLKAGWTAWLKAHGAPKTLHIGVRLMTDFYREVRVDGAALDQDDDMLLFEWLRQGDTLSVYLVRQVRANVQDAIIRQLSVRYTLPAPDDLPDSGSRWCSTPADLDAHLQWCWDQPVMQRAKEAPLSETNLYRVN